MKIKKKYTTAARGMMAMKKDVAKNVMSNLAENGTMFDKDKGKEVKMKGPKKGAKGMKYNEARGGMKVQYKMQEGGKNKTVKPQLISPFSGEPISEEKLALQYRQNKISPGDSRDKALNKQLFDMGIIDAEVDALLSKGTLTKKIKEVRAKNLKDTMMKEVNKPSRKDNVKTGEKGMTYKKGPGGMMISFVKKNK